MTFFKRVKVAFHKCWVFSAQTASGGFLLKENFTILQASADLPLVTCFHALSASLFDHANIQRCFTSNGDEHLGRHLCFVCRYHYISLSFQVITVNHFRAFDQSVQSTYPAAYRSHCMVIWTHYQLYLTSQGVKWHLVFTSVCVCVSFWKEVHQIEIHRACYTFWTSVSS